MKDDAVELVRVARIGKPHGIKGEVTVQVFTDTPESRFSLGSVLTVRGGGESVKPRLTVARSRWNKNILVVGFEEFADRNTAEAHRNVELYAQPESSSEDDGWYEEDLLDFRVIVDGEDIGKISALITGEVQDLLEVTMHNGMTALVPFVEEIVPEIDEGDGEVKLTPPPGLLTINQGD